MRQSHRDWEAEMTAQIAHQIDHWRGRLGYSAQGLSDRCAELGINVSRSTITNLETGRRGTLTVGELLGIAAALRVPPVLLLIPLGLAEVVEILPGMEVSVADALAWVGGREQETLPAPVADAAGLMTMTHRYQALLEIVRSRVALSTEELAQQVSQLRGTEAIIRGEGFIPPARLDSIDLGTGE
jgi:transcriptional regulator with XRE-family HTH domain